jgi:hypothetical protein
MGELGIRTKAKQVVYIIDLRQEGGLNQYTLIHSVDHVAGCSYKTSTNPQMYDGFNALFGMDCKL